MKKNHRRSGFRIITMFDPVETLKAYVRCPSVSTDPAFEEGMDQARRFIRGVLGGMGLRVEVVPAAGHPVILAEKPGRPEWPHIILYGHYDVQPPDPLELWQSPPFEPQERGGRLYGRGAADNKGPQLAHITAVARLMEKHPELPLRLTFLLEGEEEIGSPSFGEFIEKYRERLRGDFIILSDSLSPSPEQIAVTTGLRGVACLEVEVTGPKTDLHSGIHGGVLLNPIQALTGLCAGLHTPDGRVNVEGFYDDVIEPAAWEREEVAKLGQDKDGYADFLGVPAFHIAGDYSPFEASRFLPTLEFNGIGGGYQGEGVKTVIPAAARCKISCRLVPNQDPVKIQEAVTAALRRRCPDKVKLDIRFGHYGAPYVVVPPGRSNTPPDQPPVLAAAFRAARQAVAAAFGRPPLYLREGGSIPIIAELKRAAGLDSIMVGLFTHLDNLHAPNESCDLEMFKKGIAMSEQLLSALAFPSGKL